MATTSIWSIRGQISKVLTYAANPDKTENPDYLNDVEAGSLESALDYTTNPHKTEEQFYVSGINCTPENACKKMNRTKKQFDKSGGIVAFHSYQSFKPGETTPETAHEIGVKLASELWGDRYEMVISTHLDKAHLHNHIIINSVSFADGKRFHSDSKCYHDMRRASDRLCAEYELSVIRDPKHGKSKHYGEWNAEREGKPTWRKLIKSDVDEAIEKAMTDRQFYQNLKNIGYEIKTGEDISVRPPGKERFVRLARNFGDDYIYEAITRRILANKQPRLPVPRPKSNTQQPAKRTTLPHGSIIGLYRQYKYLLGHYSRGSPSNDRMHFLLREDIRHLNAITNEMKLLEREHIQTAEQLLSYEATLSRDIQKLIGERKSIRAEVRTHRKPGSDKPTDPRITQINEQLKTKRREVKQCQNIASRSNIICEKLEQMDKQEQEVNLDGRRNRSSRAAGKNNSSRQ